MSAVVTTTILLYNHGSIRRCIILSQLSAFFQAVAFPITRPQPYGIFDLSITIIGVAFSIFFALRPVKSDASLQKRLFFTGIFLAVSELFKQFFLYFAVNGSQFDWWYFPFQLCSVPMYLALFLPLVSAKYQAVFLTFIQDFGLLGGVMALLEPSGLLHPYLLLTLHGLVWHFLLIFMALSCAVWRSEGKKNAGFPACLPLFILCCVLATAINILSHPYGNADMFYISPYYPNGQIVFHQISLHIGVLAGNLLYLLSVIFGGWVCHHITGFFHEQYHKK